MTTAAEAQAELDRARREFSSPPAREDEATKWLRHQMETYRNALRAIASGELTRNKAVQAATAALQKGEVYRVLALRVSEQAVAPAPLSTVRT